MIVLSADDVSENFEKWKMVNDIIIDNRTPQMKVAWSKRGYEGVFDLVPKHFGMSRMYRNKRSHITFEFTEEEFTMFVLRWS